jgi:hypothetical protein
MIWPQNRLYDFLQFHLKTAGCGFLALGLKTDSYGLVIWTSKSSQWFLVCVSKSSRQMFVGCAPKPTGGWYGARHMLRSIDLLCLEESRVRIFHFASKLADTRWRVVHVAPSWRSHEDQVEDGRVDTTGCVGPCYLCFAVFLLCHMGKFVF